MKSLLILVEGYPSYEKLYNMAFVHTRNVEYQKQGFEVEVQSFSAKTSYVFEGVSVFAKNEDIDYAKYDAVLSHAPNIRNHYRVIRRKLSSINRLVLFFHGHEILINEAYYPPPYAWQKNASFIARKLITLYDYVKLYMIRGLLKKPKVKAVFVSKWMLEEGVKCLRLPAEYLNKCSVINNPINYQFYQSRYAYRPGKHRADFITVRPLDGRKYAIDKVVELARNNPDFTFHVYGKGEFFDHIVKPVNISVFDRYIAQKDMPELLNCYRAAVMPTRLDAQGVMMCEMASYGIPLLTSDLPVCREMLENFDNCTFVDNDVFANTDLTVYDFGSLTDFSVSEKFSPATLARAELDFIFRVNSDGDQNIK